MYKPLPKHVLDEDGAGLQDKVSRKEYVSTLMKTELPEKRLKGGDDEDLKYKAQVLDNVVPRWKKPVSKQKARNFLTCKERRELKVFHIEPTGHRFDDYLPLHQLWLDYMKDVVDIERLGQETLCTFSENQNRILKADYHGCYLTVKRSKCPSLVGMSGIVLLETRNTFKIITKKDQIKCLPKENSVFVFRIETVLFTLHGNQFRVKASERSRRKFKSKATIDI